MKHSLFILTLLMASYFPASAQHILSSNGQSDTASSIQVDWSVGEAIIETSTISSGIVTNGFEQHTFVVSSIEKINSGDQLNVTVFPNPMNNQLTIRLSEEVHEGLNAQLYNAQGKLIENYSLHSLENTVDVGDLPAAAYYLIIHSNSYYEKFSLIKSK